MNSKSRKNTAKTNSSGSTGLQSRTTQNVGGSSQPPINITNSSVQIRRRSNPNSSRRRYSQDGYALNFHTLVKQVYAFGNLAENFIIPLNPIFWIGTTPSTVACAHSNYQIQKLGVTWVTQLGSNDGGNLQFGVQMANTISFDPVARSSSTSYTAISLASRRYTTWLDISKMTTTLKLNVNDSTTMPVLVCNVNWIPVSASSELSLVGELYFDGTIVFTNPTNVILKPIAFQETLANVISNPNRTSNDSMYVIREPDSFTKNLYLKAMSGTSTVGPIFMRLLKLGQRIVKKVTENAVQIIIQEFASEFSRTEASSIVESIKQANNDPVDAEVQVFGFDNEVVTIQEPEPVFSVEIVGTPQFLPFSDINEGYILTHSMDIVPVHLLKLEDGNCKLSPTSYWINLDILRINNWPGEISDKGWWAYSKEIAFQVYNHIEPKMDAIFKQALATCGIDYFCFTPHRYYPYEGTGTFDLCQYFINTLGSFLMPAIAGDKVYYGTHAEWVLPPSQTEPSTGEEADEKYTYLEAYPVPNCTTYGNATFSVQRIFPENMYLAAFNMCYDRSTYQTIEAPTVYFEPALTWNEAAILSNPLEWQHHPLASSSSSSSTSSSSSSSST